MLVTMHTISAYTDHYQKYLAVNIILLSRIKLTIALFAACWGNGH
jgi:hypothetical protein